MIETAALTQLVFDAFTGKTTWLWAAAQYPLDEFVDAFRRIRATMHKTMDGITDAQAAYQTDSVPTWSLSETITHLIYSQNGYYNGLIDLTRTPLAHIAEAAKGFGEGAKRGVPAAELRDNLQKATVSINEGIEKTRGNHDPARIENHPLFGPINYNAWILLMLGHEMDHMRQAIVMRRLARAACPADLTPPNR